MGGGYKFTVNKRPSLTAPPQKTAPPVVKPAEVEKKALQRKASLADAVMAGNLENHVQSQKSAAQAVAQAAMAKRAAQMGNSASTDIQNDMAFVPPATANSGIAASVEAM